jgi:hypothetical protein
MNIDISTNQVILLATLALWELLWKGLALWKAGTRHESVWFIVLLVVNSIGILPIIYLILKKEKAAEYKKAL